MQQLLAFARRSEARFGRVPTKMFLEETAESLRVILPPNIALELRLMDDLPALFADPEHLRRMLANLVLNSRDAMPAGGTIAISAEVVQFDSAAPYLPGVADAPYLCIKIADPGVGMDEATRLRVFEPFFTTKLLRNGAGLGLPEVFGLMRTHNGLIDIKSQPGVGTEVSLFFPLRREEVVPGQVRKHAPIAPPETTGSF